MITEFIGVGGSLELYEDKVVIRRRGLLAKMSHGLTKGDKTIYLTQISGVDMKLGGFTNGFIQFSLAGGNEALGGAWNATSDENTIMFSKAQNDTAIALKEEIERLKSTTNTNQSINQVSDADELRKFKELFDEGIISEDDYNTKKANILGL